MLVFKIIDEPKQRFSVILNDRRVTFDLWYNQTNDRWSFDLSIDAEPVLYGRRIVPGTDLLAAFDFGLGVIFAWSDLGLPASRANLPNGIMKLYSATQEEVDAAVAS